MASPLPKVILVTGASSGIGLASAQELARRGHRVYGASRTSPDLEGSVRRIPMDVTQDVSVAQGVERILSEAGRLDVVVNNAGFGIAGAVEETSVEEARRQFETNVFGVLRVCRAVLPHFRKARNGLLINISSIGGLMGLPFEGVYSSSKFALEGMSEALRMELRPFGIRVVLVEPGDIRTSFPKNRVRTQASGETSAYQPEWGRALGVFERDEANAPGPERVARLVARIVGMRSPALRYTSGLWHQRAAVVLRRLLPGGLFEWIIRRAYGIG